MEWVIGIGIVVGVFLGGTWFGARVSKNSVKNIAENDPRILEYQRIHDIDRSHLTTAPCANRCKQYK